MGTSTADATDHGAPVPGAPRSGLRKYVRSCLLALARARGRTLVVLVTAGVPCCAMVSVLLTVTICLRWWRASENAIDGLVFPAISELGVHMPEKLVYQLGFGATGGLMAVSMLIYEALVVPFVFLAVGPAPASVRSDIAAQVQTMMMWGYASAAGVALQGILTLEHELSAQSFAHWAGAVIFMMGSMQHASASESVYDVIDKALGAAPPQGGDAACPSAEVRRVFADRGLQMAASVRRFIKNYSSLTMFAVPLVAQALRALEVDGASDNATKQVVGNGKELPADLTVMNMMGLMQWGIILQFALFFSTYAADMRAAAYGLPDTHEHRE